MPSIKIFISSVQSEFASERENLCNYIRNDAMLGRFFQPFIFEELPAINKTGDYTSNASVEGVNEGLKEVVDILIESEGLNTIELASKINKSDATTERYLRVLREKSIVEFRGAPKTGGYYFTEKVNRVLNE